MFLKSLVIRNDDQLIRNIPFQKGINLIVDETRTKNKTESGNNVGKTTVLRLINFCLGGSGTNIYKDAEFKNKTNTQIEGFLKGNNITITLTLKDNLDEPASSEIVIQRNFLKYKKKIQTINSKSFNDSDFEMELKRLIFKSSNEKPEFRQIIAKNIRDEKERLNKTIKVLSPYTTPDEYEALYLFWLGIELDTNAEKQKLLEEKKTEETFQSRLKRESSLSQVEQSLLVVERAISELTKKKETLALNDKYELELSQLNQTKYSINKYSTELGRLKLRKELIIESESGLKQELAEIDTAKIERIYQEAKALIPSIQKTFEDTLKFHNEMIAEKVKYISKELPELEAEINRVQSVIGQLLTQERTLTTNLKKTGMMETLQSLISELNKNFEQKGSLDEQKRFWDKSTKRLELINNQLKVINEGIASKDELIQNRITEFNKFFSDISLRLYGEKFVLSSDKNAKGYELNISSIGGNLGTGKKKGQIAAFDLAYIQFADAFDIPCLHFILHDQIENVHENQISNLLTEIVGNINCQYVLPVLRDKLPSNIPVKEYEILTLSQSDKLFRIQ